MIKIILFTVLLALFVILSIISFKNTDMNLCRGSVVGSLAIIIEFCILGYINCNIKIISWQNVLVLAILVAAFFMSYVAEYKKKKMIGGIILAIILGGTFALTLITTSSFKGLFTKTVDVTEKSTTVIPTIDPISKKVSIGYSIDSKGEEHYFYLEEKGGIMYYTPIKNPKVYFISSDLKEDSFIIVKTTTKTYLDKDRRDNPRWSQENKEYELHINSKDICYIETD